MPAIQADHRSQGSQHVDALLGSAWAWDEDDEHETGASPAGMFEHERDPGLGDS